jgi:transposase
MASYSCEGRGSLSAAPGRGGPSIRGEKNQAIGRSRGGRTTKIHAVTDEHCRPIAFSITGGQVPDCVAAHALLDNLPECDVVHADKGYDADALRRKIEARGALPNIPPKTNRKWKNCFSPFLYRARNAIERMFCRLKDFRRVATRYDRKATTFLAAICIAATVSYWL